MTALEVSTALAVLASPQKAKSSAWFFKSGPGQYGEGDAFIGVTVPEQRKIAKRFRDLLLPEIATLLDSKIHEHRLTALLILVDQFEQAIKGKLLGSTLRVEPETIVEFYLAHRERMNNWDLVDSSAAQILGTWLLERRPRPGKTSEVEEGRRLLSQFAQSDDLWDRRIAMIATYAFIKAGEFDDALKIAEILVHDSHDLIQKAVGWMLREVGNRDRAVEEQFLDRRAATMPRTMLRYAIEKFPAERRAHYLSLAKKDRR